ncbi:hypothetical protein [Candidatus Tokpelaia sp.]|uniref:hypothetical protein n=1 Tax=Candidatus Tokpelaia sp. TaxID=2233777 RepID=UPI00123AA859|nr:hypothetical protein [Candidatus Tokpelaia sp.]KAA6405059.1 hypothetical protein DPQ22_05705 [Candidatus Tokpelaia sp.]
MNGKDKEQVAAFIAGKGRIKSENKGSGIHANRIDSIYQINIPHGCKAVYIYPQNGSGSAIKLKTNDN